MFKRKSVNVAALIALGVAAPVFAQQAQPQPKPDQLERVEVTGSRIKTVNTDTASPVITLGAEAIRIEAKRDVEGLLNNLPQVFADQGGQVSNGSTGTATVNLRNLGAERTLVLINGRRMPAGSPRNLPTDLNQIPVSLIKRVELLTGGASAIYGSDAVAGVVNFVMNDKFEGVEVEGNYQFAMHEQSAPKIQALLASRAATNPSQFKVPGDITADGKIQDFSLTAGSNFANNKGNATIFVARKTTQALLQSERDFTACALNFSRASVANAFGGFSCGGSGTTFPARIVDFDNGVYDLLVADTPTGVRDYDGATDQYNFGPLNYFQRPSTRYSAAAYLNYDIAAAAKLYAELSFHDDSTVAQIAPSGNFLSSRTIRFENPLLTPALREAFHEANQAITDPVTGAPAPTNFLANGDVTKVYIGRRNIEGGGRQDDIRHTSYRGVLGVKGDISDALSFDLFTQVGRVVYQNTYKNDFSNSRIVRSLDVVTDPKTGSPICQSKLDGIDDKCVPWNVWVPGGVTAAATDYLSTPGFQKGFTSQAVTGASLNGDLGAYGLKSPLARNGIGFAAGVERRVERIDLSTDVAFTTGDLAGQGGPTIGVGGEYSVNDVFAELRLPLMEGRPLAELLNLSASYRKSNYSTKQKTDTFGVGLEWSPVRELKFRGSIQQSSRAANIVELFAASSLGLYDNDADPCAGDFDDTTLASEPTASLAECALTGVKPTQYGNIPESPAFQYNQITSGKASLKPEKANSVTVGVVFSPIKDFTVSVDYFDIKVKDTISTFGAVTILNQCLAKGLPIYCDKITRDPSAGSLWLEGSAIFNETLNLGSLQTKGVDLTADASFKLGSLGRLDASLIGTYLDRYVTDDLPGERSYDCAGLFGDVCGNPLPVWRQKLRLTWTTPWDFTLSATMRHVDKVKFEKDSDNPDRFGAPSTSQVPFLGARDYLDLAASYKISKNVTMRVAVNNIFDVNPPIRTQGAGLVNGNSYPQVYDSIGRVVSLNLTAKF